MAINFNFMPGALARGNTDFLEECSSLYSSHYGNWSDRSPRNPGQKIRLSVSRLRQWFAGENPASIWYARTDGMLVGYAIALQETMRGDRTVSWVTQLVVHSSFRQQGISKQLLFSIWTLTDHFAWGLVSASPYAIRALEKATRRRCVPKQICKHKRPLRAFATRNIHYLEPESKAVIGCSLSAIDTNFFVDHSGLDEMVGSVSTDQTPWLLGPLDEGWEWFAFTFNSQQPISLSPEELKKMLAASDEVAMNAYSRMTLSPEHKWATHTPTEVQHVIDFCALKSTNTVLDLGCGAGRHSLELARRGFNSVGIDYAPALIEKANENAARLNATNARFLVGDCRTTNLDQRFDAIICLYDVVGSHAENDKNQDILNNVKRHLKPGGHALISVMNFETTLKQATQVFSMANEPDKLLSLRPSRTMESTGNVFDPDFYMIDSDTQTVYRREQFTEGDSLPVEMIVRDKRFDKAEIETMCRAAGLDIMWSRFVRAGDWETELASDDKRAKEILVLCRLGSVRRQGELFP